jgi:hypothetical protein
MDKEEIKRESLKQIRFILNTFDGTNFDTIWSGIKQRIEITDDIISDKYV